MIGLDFYWDVVNEKVIKGDGPTAVNSKIGYLLSGPINKSSLATETIVYLNIHCSFTTPEGRRQPYELLEIRITRIKSTEPEDDNDYLHEYQRNSIKFEDGHYSAKLPWKQNHNNLLTTQMPKPKQKTQ